MFMLTANIIKDSFEGCNSSSGAMLEELQVHSMVCIA